MSDFISINGQVVPYEEGRIAPADAGFLHGAGLFETMRARNGKIFRLGDHLARLTRSAETLGITLALSSSQLQDLVDDLLEANGLGRCDARLRLSLTRGDLHQIDAENPAPSITLVISAGELTPYPADLYQKGMTVIVSPCKQNPESPLTGHKTTSYFDRLLALRDAQAVGAGEALWFTVHSNHLAEGSISNVFLVDKEGVLVTPPLMAPGSTKQRLCLPGITRQLALNLAIEASILPHERLITIDDLLAAREVFLTNAIMGVMPVTRLERHAIADEKPGELTRRLMQAYTARFEEETRG